MPSPTFYDGVKRVLDLSVSLAALVLGTPLWLLIAISIKLESRGPLFYAPTVVGKDGHLFQLYKFRTMLPGSDGARHQQAVLDNFRGGIASSHDEQGRPVYKTAKLESSRITRVGRFLRRLSLDEVPQFWNILKGDMSLVGPRPALQFEAELYNEQQRQRFQVLPGLTGLYQVTRRNRVAIEEMIQIDLQYVEKRGLWLDLIILAKTPSAMLLGE